MAHQDRLGIEGALLELGGEELGGGAAYNGVGTRDFLNGGIGGFFQFQPLGDAFLHEISALHGILQIIREMTGI